MVRSFASFLGVCLFALGVLNAPVRAQSASDPVYVFHTSLGNISVQLYPDVAPQTVANFLTYVNSGAYQSSFFHRSVPGFIIQGGGYRFENGSVNTIPTNAPVVNEFHISNTRGTIAMAKLGSSPNSATDQWFFNEADNSSNLDNQNGGFTVFGKVTDSASLAVMDAIAAVQTYNEGSPFDQIPLMNYQNGSAVQAGNLVTVSSITLASGAHILWNNTNGTASIWSYDTVGGTYGHQEYGPYPSWTAENMADGPDGLTHVLWDKTDGTASIWNLNNSTAQFAQYTFGPFSGWTAKNMSVGVNNTTHVLWTKSDGTASVWNYDSSAGSYTQISYGPYPGWTAMALADGGTEGLTRLLWVNTDGRMSLWSLNNSTGAFTQNTFGPYPGWTADSVSVGTDNTTHILWTNTDGRASLWNYSTANGSFTQNVYGPYPGWTAEGIADGSDGKLRVQWNNTNGTMSLWSLDNVAGVFSQFSFGPYTGWTATATTSL